MGRGTKYINLGSRRALSASYNLFSTAAKKVSRAMSLLTGARTSLLILKGPKSSGRIVDVFELWVGSCMKRHFSVDC